MLLKKVVLSFFIGITGILLFSTNGFCAPCYGTSQPEKKKFILGLQTYSIFKRDLEKDYGRLRSLQHFLNLSWGILDWLCLDLKGGLGNIKQHPSTEDELDYNCSFAGGYGFRIKFYDDKNIKLVFGFQHISVHPEVIKFDDIKNQAILDDWQVSLLGSYQLKLFNPYLGLRWSRLDYIHKLNQERKRKMSDLSESLGLIIGSDFYLTPKIFINLEAQFLDSKATALSINYKF
ncbi:MAG: hypothetical protein NC912_06310 [Candidatus Omnitrophica bacterium]|nr:hypothetical protein [Candidatus Omnitrophota bacterium]